MTDGYNRNNNTNQKPPNVLREYPLQLTGEVITDPKRPPALSFNVKRDGKTGPWMVLLEARTNVEEDSKNDYGKIPFMLDMQTMFMILGMIQSAAASAAAGKEPNFDRIEIASRRYLRQQNGWSKEPMLNGTIAVGWNAAGEVYMGVKSYDAARPNCKFIFKPVVDYRRSVKLFKKDGTAWENGPLSQAYALGWSEVMGKMIAAVYVDEFTPPPPRDNDNGGGNNRGGGNNYQNNNQNNSGYQGGQSNNSGGGSASKGWSDDDIPM